MMHLKVCEDFPSLIHPKTQSSDRTEKEILTSAILFAFAHLSLNNKYFLVVFLRFCLLT